MSNKIDDIVNKLTNALPEGLADTKEELESNFRSTIQGALNQMNFVSREDFDIQVKVLERAKDQLNRLEQQINVLTGNNNQDNDSD